MKNYILLSVLLVFLSSNFLFADDRNPNTNSSKLSSEHFAPDSKTPNQKIVNISQQLELDAQLKQAIESGNKNLEIQIRDQINAISPTDKLDPKYQSDLYRDEIGPVNDNPPFNPDWMSNDVSIYSGDIGHTSTDHFRTDIKMGKDGWLYAGFIRRPVTGTNGRIDVYRSENGGLNWIYVNSVQSATGYFGQISLTVNSRGVSADSTRITVFYSRSTNSNFDDATINWVSFRRDGGDWVGGVPVLTPSAGNKLLYPNAVSDGQYYVSATYINMICGEYNNAGTQMVALRNSRTTDWGANFTSTSITDGYPTWSDWLPSASFKKGTSLATDSIYIAVERRFASTSPNVRIISTTQTPQTGFYRYGLTSSTTVSYIKPSITIQQDAASLPKKILVAFIRDGQALYHLSSNSGSSWVFNATFSLVNETNVSFVSVSSDSNSAGGDNFIGCFQKGDGDTIVVRRGTIGSMGPREVKPNEFRSSTFNSPRVAIYNSNGNKYSALLYTGIVSNYTSNVYFDQENLPTNIEPTSNNLAESYSLSQNFPNPFNPETSINFNIPTQGMVKLVVYDMLGKEVATLVNQNMQPGSYDVTFNSKGLNSGVYFYKLSAGDFNEVKKMVLVK